MPFARRSSTLRLLLPAIAAAAIVAPATAQSRNEPPPDATDPLVRQALAAEWLEEDERRRLRIFHGAWTPADLDRPTDAALAALLDGRFLDAAFDDPSVPALLRAEALLGRGDFAAALAMVADDPSLRGLAIRIECLEHLGRGDEADAAIAALPPRSAAAGNDAAALVDAAKVIAFQGRFEGDSARSHPLAMSLLARARGEIDRLHWPALLLEAELLLEKDNPEEAEAALRGALAFNPRSAAVWNLIGRAAVERFDFAGVERAAERLRAIDPSHPAADRLEARMWLVRGDPAAAEALVEGVLAANSADLDALALRPAIEAARYDFEAMQRRLAELDARLPRQAIGWLEAGRQLAMDRQYPEAADALAEASRRRPRWAAPRIELAMLEMQSGRDALALSALEEAAALDPFNRRAANALTLLREIAGYRRIRTEFFEIRHREGIDEILAEMMPAALDAMHREVAARFRHEPPAPTVIEILPDHPTFAVRITGMPWIHTVAACTGPVIAMEVPRRGSRRKHLGVFDWLEVLRHEYAHTITLSQTRNRIPHWLTEAAATSVETTPRDYPTSELLARSLLGEGLLPLAEIDWAFVRPKRPTDRGLAYAQGRWMVEYLDEAFGDEALVSLLERFREGRSEAEAFEAVLGMPPVEFERRFLDWARSEVRAWGLDPVPSVADLVAAAGLDEATPGRGGSVVDDATLAEWLEDWPEHPDLLEMALRRRLPADAPGNGTVPMEIATLLERYARARPADPYPHRILARIHLASEDPLAAIPHLEALDRTERDDNIYAIELARQLRAAGRRPDAFAAVSKAVRIDPYDAPLRELAAAIAIEASEPEAAGMHLRALLLLEPDRPIHRRRLEAFESRLGSG